MSHILGAQSLLGVQIVQLREVRTDFVVDLPLHLRLHFVLESLLLHSKSVLNLKELFNGLLRLSVQRVVQVLRRSVDHHYINFLSKPINPLLLVQKVLLLLHLDLQLQNFEELVNLHLAEPQVLQSLHPVLVLVDGPLVGHFVEHHGERADVFERKLLLLNTLLNLFPQVGKPSRIH